MSELKPCPFCGGSAAIRMTGSGHFVECDSCMAKVGSAGYGFDLDDVATAAWNQRVNTAWTDTPGAWTDEDIDAAIERNAHRDDGMAMGIALVQRLLQKMRADYEAQLAAAQQRIAELERKAEWVLVDAPIICACSNPLCTTTISPVHGWPEHLKIETADEVIPMILPDDVRLMIRRQVQEGAEG